MKMSAIFTRPITAATFTVSKSRKIQEPSNILAKRLDFLGESNCRKSVSWDIRRRNPSIMKGTNWVRATTSEEGVPAFEHEALVDEALTFEAGGLEATINNLSKWLVAALFAAIIVWRHDAESLWAAMGCAINAMLSIALKQILNQERPVSTLRSDPGMPSSHAQSIVYTITFLILSLVEMYGINAFTTTLSGFFVILGSYFAWLRVSQRLHTVSQVIVGAIVGSMFSILWFWSWNTYVLNFFISFLWVRIAITLGAIGFIVGFVHHTYFA